jgi:uncharacterized protein
MGRLLGMVDKSIQRQVLGKALVWHWWIQRQLYTIWWRPLHTLHVVGRWIMLSPRTDQAFYSSVVIEHIVPVGKGFAFKRWHSQLVRAARRAEGFLRADLGPPLHCADGVIKWYSIVHFNTPDRLNAWVGSGDRKQLFEAGQNIFRAYRFKSFTTGLEGWFSQESGSAERSGLGPPAWKQVLSVVLGLYPVVMLQGIVFTALGVMQGWSFASSMLVNNVITSSILSWLVMPRIARMLSFWLRPAYRLRAWQTDLLGATLVTGLLVLMMALFNQLR